jgi:hypothetical protein
MRTIGKVFLALLLLCPAAQAQWRQGGQELGLFSGGGPAITGGLTGRGFWLAGARWGYQLTGDHGSSWAAGHLQYGVEFIPLYLQFQSNTVYGIGLTPFLLRYHFTRLGKVVPLIEVGAGMLGTRDQVPEGTSRFNFTPQAGLGIQVVPPASHYGFTAGIRYHHTSNAGLARHNPGINAVMLHAGISWWR